MSDCGDDFWAPPAKRARQGAITVRKNGVEVQVEADDDGGGGAKDPTTELVALVNVQHDLYLGADKCWGCKHMFIPDSRKEQLEVWAIWDFYERSRGILTDGALYEALSEFHEKEVVKPRLAAGMPVEYWSARMIEAHFATHVVNPRVTFLDRFRSLRDMQLQLKNELYYKDANGKTRTDHKTLQMYLKVEEKMTALQNAKTDHLQERL